jgi:hypothetical protein
MAQADLLPSCSVETPSEAIFPLPACVLGVRFDTGVTPPPLLRLLAHNPVPRRTLQHQQSQEQWQLRNCTSAASHRPGPCRAAC